MADLDISYTIFVEHALHCWFDPAELNKGPANNISSPGYNIFGLANALLQDWESDLACRDANFNIKKGLPKPPDTVTATDE